MYTGFCAVARGESHKEKDMPCQDAARYAPYKNGGIIAVSDGHGSEKHFRSDIGAALAVETAHNALFKFNQLLGTEAQKPPGAKRFAERDMREEQIKQLERSIITIWRSAVLEHCAAHPLNEGERGLCAQLKLDGADENTKVRFYGATLIAALLKKEYWFVIQIGDGGCVILDAQGRASFPEINDEALGFGKTTSLCDSNAAANFRHIYGFAPIKGITAASDGVTDSFIPEAYLEFHEKFYADLRRARKPALEGVQSAVGKWAAAGSRDDASMAGVFEL